SSLVPIVVISAIYGTGVLAHTFGRLPHVRKSAVIWLLCVGVLATSLTYHYYRGFTPLSPSFAMTWPGAHEAIGERLIASIPAEAPVSAQFNLGPHLSQRADLRMFPDVGDAEYILLDVTTQPNAVGLNDGFHDRIREALDRPDFGVIAAEDGFILLQRGAPHRALPDEFYSFARAAEANPSHSLRIRFADAVELLGYDVQTSRDARVDLTLYWRALRPMKEDLFLAVYLTDGQGKELGATQYRQPANYWYLTSRWQVGEVVRMQTLMLPWDPRGDFGLGVGVVDGTDPWDVGRRLLPAVEEAETMVGAVANGSIAEIAYFDQNRGLVAQEARARQRGELAGDSSPVANFGGRVELTGYDVSPAPAAPGEDLRVVLNWRVLGSLDQRLTTFVHLLAPGPSVAAQKDSPPLGGRLPTTFWLAGDSIADEYLVSLPRSLAPGKYEIEVGLYEPVSGARVALTDASGQQSDHLILGSIEVKAGSAEAPR
nr:DUF2079 domain-containing protein [Dehalococcoidales bacterium]